MLQRWSGLGLCSETGISQLARLPPNGCAWSSYNPQARRLTFAELPSLRCPKLIFCVAQTKELNNGRLAMIAIAAFTVQVGSPALKDKSVLSFNLGMGLTDSMICKALRSVSCKLEGSRSEQVCIDDYQVMEGAYMLRARMRCKANHSLSQTHAWKEDIAAHLATAVVQLPLRHSPHSHAGADHRPGGL